MDLSKKNILKNGLSSLGQKGVRVLEQLFLIPFFISHWGTAYYGEWLTLTIIPSVIAFSDLGLGTAAANSFVLSYTGGRLQEAANILKTGFIIITRVILVGILLGILGIFITKHFNLLTQSLITTDEACYALFFMILAKFLNFYMQLYEAGFRAIRRAHLGINLQTLSGFLNVAVCLIFLYLGYGVIGVALGQLLISIFDNLVYGGIAKKMLGINRKVKGIYDKKFARETFKIGIGYLLSPMWQIILFQGTTFVVRITLGPSAVALFNTMRTLSSSIKQMYAIVNTSIFPELQFEIGEGNFDRAMSLLKKAMKFTVIIGGLGFIIMSVVGLPVYNWWTHKMFSPSYSFWFTIILSTAINALWWTSSVVFRAVNKPYKLSISGVVFAVLSIITSYFGCKFFGIIGAAFGALFFEVCMCLYIIPKSFILIKNN